MDRFRLKTVVIAVVLAGCQTPGGGSSTATSGAAASVPVTPTPAATPAPTAAVTLPGGRLVFDRFRGSPEDPYLGTFILDSTAAEPVELDLPIHGEGGTFPVWSPDGTQLVVNIWTPAEGARVAVIHPDGSAFRLIEPKGFETGLFCSSWSPDALRLLCGIDSPNPKRDGIYDVLADGSAVTRLTTSPVHHTVGSAGECGGGESRGVYSPDGTSFAFIRQYCGTGADPSSDEYGALLIADNDGSRQQVIVEKGVRTHAGSQLGWSPDGGWIVFGTQSLSLARVHPDGTGYEVIHVDLGATGAGALGPGWSPDGASIVFATDLGGRLGNLYVVAADGAGAARLPGTAGAAFPHWGP